MFIFSRRLMIMAYVSDPSFRNSFIHDSPAGSATGDPERSNVTLKLLRLRTGHSALWPLRPEIRQAIMSGHWPRLNQRKSRTLVYVWECYADNYDRPINKSTLGWNEMGCVSAWESLCVSHQRWRCCRGRRIWPKLFFWSWTSRGPVLSHVHLSVQIKPMGADKALQSGETAGYSDNVMRWSPHIIKGSYQDKVKCFMVYLQQ